MGCKATVLEAMQRFVDDQRSHERTDALPRQMRPFATRSRNDEATSREAPPRSSLEEIEAALEDFRAKVDRTQRVTYGF
jgi:hypothetical protein